MNRHRMHSSHFNLRLGIDTELGDHVCPGQVFRFFSIRVVTTTPERALGDSGRSRSKKGCLAWAPIEAKQPFVAIQNMHRTRDNL